MNKGGFSWKGFLGITGFKQKIARKTGIPLSQSSVERKIGRTILKLIGIKK